MGELEVQLEHRQAALLERLRRLLREVGPGPVEYGGGQQQDVEAHAVGGLGRHGLPNWVGLIGAGMGFAMDGMEPADETMAIPVAYCLRPFLSKQISIFH